MEKTELTLQRMSLLSMGIEVAKQTNIPKAIYGRVLLWGLKVVIEYCVCLDQGHTQADWQMAVRRMSAEDFQGTVVSVRERSDRRSLLANGQQPAVQ